MTVQRIFFLERGQVNLPEDVYVFELSPADALRLKQESIRVVPFFDKKIFRQKQNKEYMIEVVPIPTEEGVYYSRKIYNGKKLIGKYPKDYDEILASIHDNTPNWLVRFIIQ